MDKKIKLDQNAWTIAGGVFAFIGVIYSLLGIVLSQFPEDQDDATVGIVFAILGGVMLALAVCIMLYGMHYRKRLQKIVENGKYLWGEITDIVPNYHARINNRNPYNVLVRYQDRNGVVHIFRSVNQNTYPDRSIIGKQVKVYYENEEFKRYYVDLEGVLPTVMEH